MSDANEKIYREDHADKLEENHRIAVIATVGAVACTAGAYAFDSITVAAGAAVLWGVGTYNFIKYEKSCSQSDISE